MVKLRRSLGLGWLLGCAAGSWACGGGDGSWLTPPEIPIEGDTDFTSSSANPGNSSPGEAENAAGDGIALDASSADTASRAITEADILQLSGDRLYALSRYRGLTIVDASDPARLRVEGEYRAAAEPFEMYVEDGLVYAMFNGWSSYVCDEQSGVCDWQTESRVQALDTRDPANIEVIADLKVPGYIADSRRVGDILYMATAEWGYCWGCQPENNTTVTSFDLSVPGRFTQVDQLRLPSPPNQSSDGHSIIATDQRIYIAGYEYDTVDYTPLPSSVQVVDIADPGGALERGARFDIAGTILSRWQMDEYDGVFRAVSQPGGWGTDEPPVMQTFRVNSSADIQPLASLTVQLPRPREVLQSARFDAGRGYLITAEQRDPLFTFDLSDPSAPRQLGELEMPGWVYHMEPRGNRIYALGYDPENPEGSLNVSLFDVENLAEPVLLSRVAFGGVWGGFAEGQNQIHKAFSILADRGLILVPFSGSSYEEATCEYSYGSGIQLVDFTDTTLTRRGVAAQVGTARRSLMHRDHLFGIGDNAVQTFDIQDRDAPRATARLDVARNVSTVRVLGDHLMRFGSDWATNQTTLELTPVERAGEAEPQSEIDLSAVFGQDTSSCSGSTYWTGQVFTRGDYAYTPRMSYRYDAARGTTSQLVTLHVVDLSDRSAPRAIGSLPIPTGTDFYVTNIIQTENTLLVGRQRGNYNVTGDGRASYFYDVIDLGDPAAPSISSTFEVPAAIANSGWGYFGVGGCSMDMGWGWYGETTSATLTDGDLVISQHAEPVGDNPRRMRYYLDRIDVSDPRQPRMLPPINIPGTAIQFKASTNELVTLDHQETPEAATGHEDCYGRGYYAQFFSGSPEVCLVTRRSLNSLVIDGEHAVLTGRIELDDTSRAQSIAVSDTRIFYTTGSFPRYYALHTGEANAPQGTIPVTLEAVTLQNGTLVRLPSQELRRMAADSWYHSQLFARGDRVFELFNNTVTVIDTNVPEAPTRLERELPIWGCQSLEVADDTAYCAAGQRGVEVIDLSSLR